MRLSLDNLEREALSPSELLVHWAASLEMLAGTLLPLGRGLLEREGPQRLETESADGFI